MSTMAQQPTTSSGTAAWMRATAATTSPKTPNPRPAAALIDRAFTAPPADGVRRAGRLVEAADRAELPRRCACCGDSIDLHTFRTMPGRVRYYICQEHLVSAIARLVVAAVMLLVVCVLAAKGFPGGRKSMMACGLIGFGGLAMAWFAIPVRAGRSRGGWRTLRGVCRTVADDLH